MNSLAIETSTKVFRLAVAKNGKAIFHRDIILKKVLSDSIIPAIERILQQAKIPLNQVDGFAIGLGPGSFTSLRVGMATVKGFAFALNKPVVGISSLDIIAANVIGEACDEICVIVDARRNLVYAALYDVIKGALKRKSEYLLTDIAKLLDQVRGRTLFVGDAIPLFREEICRRYETAAQEHPTGCAAIFADEKSWFPKAQALAQLTMKRFEKKKFDNIDKLVPLYLYPEDCQVQKKS